MFPFLQAVIILHMVKTRTYYDAGLDPLVEIMVADLTHPELVQYHRTLGKGKKMRTGRI